ncbi:MAG: isoprenyl transferase [Actinomycetia bacterium]|nr:isoprenyl transferase [Actinomycetes bacterium]
MLTPKVKDLKKGSVPQHVGIIMDGNGRWAARRHLPRVVGHRAGVATLRQVIKTSVELGVKYLTVFAFSSENWDRPQREVDFLMDLFVDTLGQELDSLNKNGVKIKIIGSKKKTPEKVLQCFNHAEDITSSNNKMVFNIAFNYGSRGEIIDAVKNIIRDCRRGKVDIEDINEKLISSYTYTRECPDPDLIIRTSGEYRISNFLLWQSAYTEFYFTRTLWPDFSKKHYLRAIQNYQKRNRRFGRVQ